MATHGSTHVFLATALVLAAMKLIAFLIAGGAGAMRHTMFASQVVASSPTSCLDDPKGILAADGTTCAQKMAKWECNTVDHDYNGYTVTYSQLCPETCSACDSYTEPECHRPDVCCCEEDQGVDCASDEAAECVRRCSQCITDPAGGDADGAACDGCDVCGPYVPCTGLDPPSTDKCGECMQQQCGNLPPDQSDCDCLAGPCRLACNEQHGEESVQA